MAIQVEYGSFNNYIWSFVKGQTVHNAWRHASEVPASSNVSLQISNALKKRGFKFVGSVICYAYMQAIGMINDHTVDCFRYAKINTL